MKLNGSKSEQDDVLAEYSTADSKECSTELQPTFR